MRGDGGHGGDEEHGVQQRDLYGVGEGGGGGAAMDIVDAENIGEEEPIEQATLEGAGEVGPVGECVVGGGVVARVGPEALLDVPGGGHVEGVEADVGHFTYRKQDGERYILLEILSHRSVSRKD